MSTARLVGIQVIAIAIIVVLIVKYKLHASIELILAAFFVGFTSHMPPEKLPNMIEKGASDTLGFLTLIIGLGAILGKMLEESRWAAYLASTLSSKLGYSRTTGAMMRCY